jgi:hypothetical protein
VNERGKKKKNPQKDQFWNVKGEVIVTEPWLQHKQHVQVKSHILWIISIPNVQHFTSQNKICQVPKAQTSLISPTEKEDNNLELNTFFIKNSYNLSN